MEVKNMVSKRGVLLYKKVAKACGKFKLISSIETTIKINNGKAFNKMSI